MQILQLLGTLSATPDIEIVITWLPEVVATSDEALCDGLLQGFKSLCENSVVPGDSIFFPTLPSTAPSASCWAIMSPPLSGLCSCQLSHYSNPNGSSDTDSLRAVARVARSGSVTNR
jgi:hypothetical protein